MLRKKRAVKVERKRKKLKKFIKTSYSHQICVLVLGTIISSLKRYIHLFLFNNQALYLFVYIKQLSLF